MLLELKWNYKLIFEFELGNSIDIFKHCNNNENRDKNFSFYFIFLSSAFFFKRINFRIFQTIKIYSLKIAEQKLVYDWHRRQQFSSAKENRKRSDSKRHRNCIFMTIGIEFQYFHTFFQTDFPNSSTFLCTHRQTLFECKYK